MSPFPPASAGMDASSHAGPSSPSQHVQHTPPIPLSERTSSKNFRAELCALDDSPPSTPPPHTRRSYREKGKQSLRAYASEEPLTATESQARHSHGLSWNSTTRDSVVDNLLFSLDNLARPADVDDTTMSSRDLDEKRLYLADLASTHTVNEAIRRSRGHTHSSSAEYDRQILDSPASRVSSVRHSTTGTLVLGGPLTRAMSDGKGTRESLDIIDSARSSRTIGAQTRREEEQEEDSSRYHGLDVTMEQNRTPWAGYRSMSLDHVAAESDRAGPSMLDRGRPVPSIHSKYEAAWETEAAAPEPIIAAGPRKMQNPNATGPVFVTQPSSKSNKQSTTSLRKTTTQHDLRASTLPSPTTPIPADIRDQAADFVRNNSIRGTPLIPTTDRENTAPNSWGGPASKKKETSSILPSEKPGFFKRVFGGASRAVSSNDRPMSISPPSTAPHRARSQTSAASHPKTEVRQPTPSGSTAATPPPPTLNKKPSSFFRRRKKSMSDSAPPPLPLSVNQMTVQTAQPSPSISSLRKVMDPYLSQQKNQSGVSSMDDNELERPLTSDTNSDSLEIFHPGYTTSIDATLTPRKVVSRGLSSRGAPDSADSPHGKLKIRKRALDTAAVSSLTPRVEESSGRVSAVSSIGPLDSSLSAVSANLSAGRVSAQSDRRPSTGDGIIAQETQEAIDMANMAGLYDDEYVIKRNTEQPRADAPKPARLVLQPTLSEEAMVNIVARRPSINSPTSNTPSRLASGSTRPDTAASTVDSRKVHRSPSDASSLPMTSANILSLPNFNMEGDEFARVPDAMPMSPSFATEDDEYRQRALKILDGDEEDISKADAAAWMGENNTLSAKTLHAYMKLFDFVGMSILGALRSLCSKLVLRGETQQFDRIITALSSRWCECNPSHGFKAQDVVHTITYSLILLNTDLHLADIGEKMSRRAYVKNTLPTVRRVVTDAAPSAFDESTRAQGLRPSIPWTETPTTPNFPPPATPNDSLSVEDTARLGTASGSAKRLSYRPGMSRGDSENALDPLGGGATNALVNTPWTGSLKGWEAEIESVLKSFWTSIRNDPLPLHGAVIEHPVLDRSNNSLSLLNVNTLKRTGSMVSRAPSENMSYRSKQDLRSMSMRWQGRNTKSRGKVYPSSTVGSSRTSLDDGNSIWSPAQSSKYSFSKTLTSASVGSLGYHHQPDFKHSIGFANALSQAIIREETAGGVDFDSFTIPGGLLEDESLALQGAPWAKEGLVKHKHHLETPDRKAKERSWADCFAVISKGKLQLFAFGTSSSKSQSLGRKNHFTKSGRAASVTGARVGGGDWMENADKLGEFVLRQTIASTLPPPGYSKTRPHVWALSLPTGAVHLFQVGTPEIAEEFMSTANYWSARLSKEPLAGGVSNIEYGWSENIINPALLDQSNRAPSVHSPKSSIHHHSRQNTATYQSMSSDRGMSSPVHSGSQGHMSRPSIQSSLRSSIDQGFGGGSRTRLPGDKVTLQEWQPPTQSMMASALMEVDQLRQLTAYVAASEEELEKHNEMKHAIELAFSNRGVNFSKAMNNWQRKSDYLLREIVKFRTYIDSLTAAQKAKEQYYTRKNGGRLSPVAKDDGEDGSNRTALTMDQLLASANQIPSSPDFPMANITPRGIHTSG